MRLQEEQDEADGQMEVCRDLIGCGPEGWVPVERYEEAMARCRALKADSLIETSSEDERAEVLAHWPFDDMDEQDYM